jgi:Holliday junction resolvase RusA-like endonuclease
MSDINHENELKMREEFSNAILNNVGTTISYWKHIGWNTVKITINNEPKPSQRPRLSGYRVYVPGAYKNTAFFHKYVLPTLGDLWINTPCKTKIDIYVKTPSSFSKAQKLLAEMKILRPWVRSGDIDNFEKSCLDAMVGNKKRGHKGIMSDDCIVIDMDSHKYYSETPRYEIEITYMDTIPECIKRILKIEEIERDNGND